MIAQIDILDMHSAEGTKPYEQALYHVRAKCASESWEAEDANLENVVEAPCRTVRLLAQAYAEREGFPAVLRIA